MRSKHPDQVVADAEEVLALIADESAVDGTDQTLAAVAEVRVR